MDERLIAENLGRSGSHLLFAGQDVPALAAQYGTPLYLMDEDCIRARCRTYRSAVEAFARPGRILYASKAAAFLQMFRIAAEEGLSADVVSAGELYTAYKAGFPMENVWFHSSNKTDEDIAFAMEHGVGLFIVDNFEELEAIERIASERGTRQRILLRLTPGIDPHTFDAVATGKVDSKFGFGMETGAADQAVRRALAAPHLLLGGFHCHVGSQVFDSDVFLRSASILFAFMAKVRSQYGYTADQLDLGGGYGVRYLAGDPVPDYAASIRKIGAHIDALCQGFDYPAPEISLEPGRSIVGDAGLTVYTVGMVKRIPNVRNYVSVDGGMTDNIRYALYGAPYTVLPANRMDEASEMLCTVVGRCCESGDVIQPDVMLPDSTCRGDRIAVCTTGAYHYSMASNYNRLPRPPIVMLRGGTSYVAVRRESLDDLLQCDQ